MRVRPVQMPTVVLSIGKRERDSREAEVHTNECYWVGMGYLGGLKRLKRRRFLRIRSAEGICSYLLWTSPDRGKQYMFCSQFRKRVQISKEEAEHHFKMKL